MSWYAEMYGFYCDDELAADAQYDRPGISPSELHRRMDAVREIDSAGAAQSLCAFIDCSIEERPFSIVLTRQAQNWEPELELAA